MIPSPMKLGIPVLFIMLPLMSFLIKLENFGSAKDGEDWWRWGDGNLIYLDFIMTVS